MRNNERGNDGPTTADGEVLGFHRATGTKRGSGVQQRFQPRQTDNESSLLKLEVVRDDERGNDSPTTADGEVLGFHRATGTKRG